MDVPADKPCATCGRRITWRRKWARDWENVRYCSDACRKAKPGAREAELDTALLARVMREGVRASVCINDLASDIGGVGEERMEAVRRSARRLVARGLVRIEQGGREVDPSTARGPFRVRWTGTAPEDDAEVELRALPRRDARHRKG